MDKHTLKERDQTADKIFEMEEYINERLGSLSKGMKRRLHLLVPLFIILK